MYKLQYYRNKFSYLHVQGSNEWLNGRTVSFGGSEMATLCEANKYETWEQLQRKKIYKSYDTNDITHWGHMFEPVSKHYIKEKYGTIYNFGSIPHPYYPVCYSPDGVLIENNDLTLLEIKNPIMRNVYTIPPQYMYQIQTGMNIINVKYCLFVQFRFRRCKLNSPPKSATYDRKYHKEYRKRQPDQKPISWGYLWWDIPVPLVDLCEFDCMYAKISNFIKIHPQIIIEDKTFKPTTGYVLKWKLFDINWCGIKPDPTFLKNREKELWNKYEELYHKRIVKDCKLKVD